ncbi:DUF6083 domain-containing protein [Streptomyces neyagawaensis]|uniref:DUF6083 domain-containing protein n=1 Tax=Streptomyces neyagawaensis TaxID=42238 RepID=UPI000B2ABE4E|nr:DUF6083 domain-containing protein [Streptomyces neyagawaensis]MCL6736107.1 DUF3684 domain-containing protein [Streptomyces neyagawaensis]MDE1684071.1 DUF6083 domain-containing protein [Streptomyces neyagawaensis]
MRERGRIDLMARYCERCWNILANEMAESDGATAAPRPEPDPDDVAWIEPPVCRECGASLRVYPTTYDRWVSLAMVEMPAKDVPAAFRWRLMRLPPLSSPIPVDIVAVRVRGIDPLPSEPVVPAHRMMCVPEWGEP